MVLILANNLRTVPVASGCSRVVDPSAEGDHDQDKIIIMPRALFPKQYNKMDMKVLMQLPQSLEFSPWFLKWRALRLLHFHTMSLTSLPS